MLRTILSILVLVSIDWLNSSAGRGRLGKTRRRRQALVHHLGAFGFCEAGTTISGMRTAAFDSSRFSLMGRQFRHP